MASTKATLNTRDRINLRWHVNREDPPHTAVMAAVRKLIKQDNRRSQLLLWRDLFLDEMRGAKGERDIRWMKERARFNVIRSACETIAANIFADQPIPEIFTEGGDYDLQIKAGELTLFFRGDIERLDTDDLRFYAGFDALIFGTGCIKVDGETGRVGWRKVFRGNLVTDIREEIAGDVRTMYEIRAIDREVLAECYPKYAKRIDKLTSASYEWLAEAGAGDDASDLVAVAEAWRLPNRPGGKGRHVIVCDGVTLLDEPWKRDHFPFAFIHYGYDPLRFWGRGIPEYLCGLQSEQNYIDESISEGVRLVAGTRFLLANGARLSGDSVTNEIGEFWTVNGNATDVIPLELGPAAASMMMHAPEHRRSLLEIIGVSPLSAQAQKPAGVNSGRGLREVRTIENARFKPLGKAVDRLTVQLTKLGIETCEEIVDRDGGEKLVAYSGAQSGTFDSIAYPDVRLGDHPFQVRVASVNAFSQHPAAKREEVTEMMNAGLLSLEEAREQLDSPDLASATKVALAGRTLARKLVNEALKGNLQPAPRAVDKPFLVDWGWKQYALAKISGATESRLRKLQTLLGQVEQMIEHEAAALAEKQAASLPPPQAPMPTPPPVGGTPMPMPPGPLPFPPGMGPPQIPPIGVAA